jgi:transposase
LRMRKTYDKAFKAKVALEALRGEKTIQELAQIHGVHPQLITNWKKQLIDNAAELFERPGKVSDEEQAAERERDMMLRELGQMTIENQFLKKKYKQLYGHDPKL